MGNIWRPAADYAGTNYQSHLPNSLSRAEEADRKAEDAEQKIDKLLLINQAMWELLKERTNLTDADLLAKVQDLDLRDGTPDGKITRTVAKCPTCQRTMSPRHQKCLYCGYEKLIQTAFDAI